MGCARGGSAAGRRGRRSQPAGRHRPVVLSHGPPLVAGRGTPPSAVERRARPPPRSRGAAGRGAGGGQAGGSWAPDLQIVNPAVHVSALVAPCPVPNTAQWRSG
jgi:hypothetical protein